jgi:hypothetical protein
MPRYEDDLRIKLSKDRLPVTVGQYIQRLRAINGNAPLTSMKFLMDFDAVTKKIDSMDKAFSTKTSYYTAICAVLSMYPKYSKLYKRYVEKTMSNARQLKDEVDTNQKNEKQKDSIVPLKEIIEVRTRLKKEYDASDTIDSKVWDKYLAYILLCLYTMTHPRRNKDYSEMWFCLDDGKTLDDKNKNYYIPSQRKFIFNNYKTSTTYGQQVLPVPDDLVKVLNEYIDTYQSVIEADYEKQHIFPLLVHLSGSRINGTNGITRLLNKAIGKKIGSGALRHIYVSDKFADTLKEMKTVATGMAHDLDTARGYIKTD